MADLIQRSGQWLYDQLKTLEREVEARRVEVSQNNARIMEVADRAKRIADPATRARVQAGIARFVQRQGEIATRWRNFSKKIGETSAKAREWLRANGYARELGAIWIPVALAVAFGAGAWVWVENARFKRDSAAQRQQYDLMKPLIERHARGETTTAEFEREVRALNSAADAVTSQPDPLGLANLANSLLPIAVIAGIVLVLPMLTGGRASLRRAA